MTSEADAAREAASERVATRFSRQMKATTSPYGILTDPVLVCAATAALLVVALAYRGLAGPDAGPLMLLLQVFVLVPLVIAVAVTVALGDARNRVVTWLAELPFPMENLNALLNGIGEQLEVRFERDVPDTRALNEQLESVHTDSFVTEVHEETHTIEIRIGVVENKRNPARSNHQRWVRCKALAEKVLAPLSSKHPIAEVRVK